MGGDRRKRDRILSETRSPTRNLCEKLSFHVFDRARTHARFASLANNLSETMYGEAENSQPATRVILWFSKLTYFARERRT